MLLKFRDGRPFATGAISYNNAPGTESAKRIIIEVVIGGQLTTAIIDTALPCSTCSPDFAKLAGLTATDPHSTVESMVVRGVEVEGRLHNVNIDFLKDIGEYLPINAPMFVPDSPEKISMERVFRYLGMEGCLNTMRFAVDSRDQMFYFS
jgi:hypothetical protein